MEVSSIVILCGIPMPGIILFIIFILMIYLFTSQGDNLAATSSFIQQVWSGNCNLSCRQSGYSGLSGLNQPRYGENSTEKRVVDYDGAGPSNDCVCDTCPCGAIDGAVKACQPIINMYTSCVAKIASCFQVIVETGTSTYKDAWDCQRTCQKPRNQEISETTYSSPKPSKERADETRAKSSKATNEDLKKTLSKDSLMKRAGNKAVPIENKKKDAAAGPSHDSIRFRTESQRTLVPSKDKTKIGCHRCLSQGKVCLGTCPNSKEFKDKMNSK